MLPIRAANKTDNKAAYYERRGASATHKIASAVARKSWKWVLLNLAWTAGPVTFIALQGGHYIGFGNEAPLQSFIYFAGYTVIAGVLALLASIGHDAFYKPKVQAAQKNLLETIDRSFLLMMHIRNRILESLEPQDRRILAASFILDGVGLSPSAIETAVMDLTASPRLTRAARRIQVFAELGMQSRITDILSEVEDELARVERSLSAIAPHTMQQLTRRLYGTMPHVRDGVERREGFIVRILDAADHNRPPAMTLYDAYELVTLAFELMNGRRIAVLEAELIGPKNFTTAQHEDEVARRLYRMALRKRNSDIRLLADRLYRATPHEMVIDATDATQRLMDFIHAALSTMPHPKRALYQRQYEAILRSNQLVALRRTRLIRAASHYRKEWLAQQEAIGLAPAGSESPQHNSFYITEREITLRDREKLALAEALAALLPPNITLMEAGEIKHLTMELIGTLDTLIHLSQPDEQLAIESSNAANFAFITVGLTSPTKAGWAALAIDAVHENRRRAAHRLAGNLIGAYRLPLTQHMIDLLVERFGADPATLQKIKDDVASREPTPYDPVPPAPPLWPSWAQLIASFTLPETNKRA